MVALYNKPPRADRPEWTAAKSVGDVAEQLVARFFQQLGLAVRQSQTGAAHDLAVGGRIECKHDRIAATSGLVAIETTYRGQPSGVMSTNAGAWAVLIGREVFFIPVPRLRALVKSLPDTPAGEGAMIRLLPLATLRQHARCFVVGGATR